MSPADAPVPDARSASKDPLHGVRRVEGLDAVKALANPVRIRLIEALSIEGPLTATQAGAAIGETPTTCSFHFRQLQRFGFAEEAGGGAGRARPWKLSSLGFSFTQEDVDEETRKATEVALGVIRERQLARHRHWRRIQRSFPKEWRQAATDSEFLLWATPAELEELNRQLMTLLEPYWRERRENPHKRPEGALPVELLLFDYPIKHPDEDESRQ